MAKMEPNVLLKLYSEKVILFLKKKNFTENNSVIGDNSAVKNKILIVFRNNLLDLDEIF